MLLLHPPILLSNLVAQVAMKVEEEALILLLQHILLHPIISRKNVALLVPFRLETQHALTAPEADQVNKHAETLEQIASERSARIAPFPASTIPAREWIDDCHLSREGCRLKAAYLVPFVRAAADSLDEDD